MSVVHDVFRIANENKADAILFCGDWNHEQGKMDTLVTKASINTLRECHELYPSLKIYAISGNHDHKGKNVLDTLAPTALQVLEDALPEVFSLQDYGYTQIGDVWVGGIPYMEFPEDFYTVLDGLIKVKPDEGSTILLTHQTPAGSVDPVPSQIDPKDERLKKFDYVLNGHIHRYQWFGGNFITVGSPLQQDLGDINQTKGILLLDTDNCTITPIPLDYPQFRRVKFGETIPSEWGKDYILQDPPPAEDKQSVDIDRFGANNSPRDIVQAYGEHKAIDQETINVGLTLLQ